MASIVTGSTTQVDVDNITQITLITATIINNTNFFSLPDVSSNPQIPSQYNGGNTIPGSVKADILFNSIPISNLNNGTIMANIYLTDNSRFYIFHQQLDNNYITSFSIGYYVDNNGNFIQGTPGIVYFCFQNIIENFSSNSVISVNVWHSIAVTFNSTSWQLYIDGILDKSGTLTSYTPSVIPVYNSVTYSGLGFTNNAARISNFLIYYRTLTSNEIMQNNIFFDNTVGNILNYVVQPYSNSNIYILNNDNVGIYSSFEVPANIYFIIPRNYIMTLEANTILTIYGTLVNYGTIIISSGSAINNSSSGIFLNEFSGTIINDSISNSNTNSGKIINRGSYSNELISSTFTNGSGGIFLNKNGGTFDNTGTVINEPGGVFENYYNYLRVNNGGQVVNYGQYINDIIYEPGTAIIPPYSLIAAGSNHSLGLQYGVSGNLYAWGNNISGQLGNDDALYDISSSNPILVLNGQEYIQSPQILSNTIPYTYQTRTSNIITCSSTPKSSNILDISVNSLSLTFPLNGNGYWDISGSIVTIYGIQGNFSDISYSSIFVGGNCYFGVFDTSDNIQTISSSTINTSAYNLIITLSSYSNNFVNNNGSDTLTLTSNPIYPPTSNFLAPGTGATLTLPNTITTDPSFTVIIPQDQSYTLPNYTYNSLSSPPNPIFSFISTASISAYTINVGNSLYFNSNQLFNYHISSAATTTITITPPSPSGNTIDAVEYDASSISLFIAVGNNISTDTFPYLQGVTLSYTTNTPKSLNISSASIKQTLTATLLDLVVNTSGLNINQTVADISNNPQMTYILTTQPSLSINQPLDISTNTIGSGTLTVTTTPPTYNFALPIGIAGHSTFTINTPVNLIAPTTQFQGYFNADFSFNISYDVSPAPPSDLCGNQWISVASGGNTSFGLRDGGYLYAWGDNTSGHLGTGDVVDTSKNYPTQVDLSNCIAVSSGLNHALALDDINDLWAWGDNTYGQLGNISNNNSISPIVIYDYINTTTQTITTTQDIIIPANVYSINIRITGEQPPEHFNNYAGGFGAIVNVYNYPVIPGDKITFSINSLLGGVSSWTDQFSNIYYQNGGSGSFVYINDNSSVGQGLIAVAGGGGGGGILQGVNAGSDKNNNNGIGGLGAIYVPSTPSYNGSNGLDFINGGKGGDGVDGNAGIQDELAPGSGGGGGYGGGGGGCYSGGTSSTPARGGNGGTSTGGASDGNSYSGAAGGSYASNGVYNTIRTNTVSYSQTHYIQFNYFNTSISKYKNIACGDNHSLAIDFSNNLYTWGNNSSSQLGIGSTPDTSRNYPSLVTTPSSAYWLKAVGGSNHSLGLQSDGSLWAWGDNTYGQLGNGTINNSNVPFPVTNPLPSNIRWVDIAAGANVSMAITSTNQLYAWGSDISGQIGIVNPPYTTPQLISSPSNFIKCEIGGSHSLGISLNDLYAWGTNTTGQLGIGNTTTQYVPQIVDASLNPILPF